MIDTIKIRLANCSWLYDLDPQRWEIIESSRGVRRFNKQLKRMEEIADNGRFVTCRQSGLRIWGSLESPEWLEVSLPRLYHGRNGVLLRDDTEVSGALFLARDTALSVLDVREDMRSGFALFLYCTRVDLCWQFKGLIQKWNEAFRVCGHPRVRRPTVEHNGSGLVFPGRGLHIRMYDKRREVYHRRGEVVRLEAQLRGRVLAEFDLKRFDEAWIGGFSRLWSIFKDLVLAFNPVERTEVSTVAELLSVLEAQQVKIGSQSPFEVWASGKHRATVSRMKKLMRESLPAKCAIDLWDLCAVPVPIDLEVE